MCARSLRELARRTLRSRGVIIHLPDNINREENLAIRLSDLSPSLYFGIEYKPTLESIVVTNIGQGGGVIGLEEPDESEVWVPIDFKTGLDLLSTEIIGISIRRIPGLRRLWWTRCRHLGMNSQSENRTLRFVTN